MTTEQRDLRTGATLVASIGLAGAWLLAYSTHPSPAFYREVLAALALGVALLMLATDRAGSRFVFSEMLIACALLAGAGFIQAFRFEGSWPGLVPFMVYLLIFLGARQIGTSIAAPNAGRARELFFLALVVAGVVSCIVGALQVFNAPLPPALLLPRIYRLVYGNVGQANHFAALLAIAVVAVAMLHAYGRLGRRTSVGLVILLQTLSVFSTQRSVWMYVAIQLFLGAWLYRRGKREGSLEHACAGTILLTSAMVLPLLSAIFHFSDIHASFGLTSAVARVEEDVAGNALRLWLWQTALAAIAEYPLGGVGLGRFVGFGSRYAAVIPDAPPPGADFNAHNLFLHLSAELGVWVGVCLVILLLFWLIRVLRTLRSTTSFGALAIVSIVLAHSQVEHPLWYVYILCPFGIAVGVLDAEIRPVRLAAPAFNAAVGLIITLASVLAFQHYGHIARATNYLTAKIHTEQPVLIDADVIKELSRVPSWSPYSRVAEAIGLMSSNPRPEYARDFGERCLAAAEYAPSAFMLARCSTALYLAGNIEQARNFATRVCRFFPRSAWYLAQSFSLAGFGQTEVETIGAPCLRFEPK